ncbi:MAG: hypothetical protein LBF75_00735 [Treponema sp.]|jgi:hypothetical protein|nr:hypothetical protein [Treponema sp.]
MAELIQPQMGLNFEQVWAAFMENRQQIKETQQQMKETDRLIRELRDDRKETDRLFRESKAETDRQMKELQKSIGYLSNRFGELAEHLVLPNIVQKFNALNYHFNDIAKERKFVNPDTGRVEAEFDILLENDAYSIAVEIKAKPAEKDVADHISRLEFLRRHKDQRGDSREIRGALAGAIMPEAVRKEALRAGLYVIEQSGDTVRIEEPNQLRSW